MGFIYLLMAVTQGLMQLLYLALVFGVPALIALKLYHNRRNAGKFALWAALGVVWIIPMVVEAARDQLLVRWVATLPPAPILMVPQGSVLVLDGGVINPYNGRAQFAQCKGVEYGTPLCDFSVGAEVALNRHTLALQNEGTAQHIVWAQATQNSTDPQGNGCDLEQHDSFLSEPFSAYLVAQGICATSLPQPPIAPQVTIGYQTEPIPWFPGHSYGQLVATGATSTTLTAFSLPRPNFPALWGVHWLPVLANLLPKVSTTYHHSMNLDQTAVMDMPRGSFQNLVYTQGWNTDPAYDKDIWATLDTLFPYSADRALPALRSNLFFPSRFAVELACAPAFTARITAPVLAEVRRIATQSSGIGNDYPRQLAVDALAAGCGAGIGTDVGNP